MRYARGIFAIEWHGIALEPLISPELSHGQAYRLQFRLSSWLGDHEFVIETEFSTAPKAKSRSGTNPERVRHIALFGSIDARFTADIIISIGRQP